MRVAAIIAAALVVVVLGTLLSRKREAPVASYSSAIEVEQPPTPVTEEDTDPVEPVVQPVAVSEGPAVGLREMARILSSIPPVMFGASNQLAGYGAVLFVSDMAEQGYSDEATIASFKAASGLTGAEALVRHALSKAFVNATLQEHYQAVLAEPDSGFAEVAKALESSGIQLDPSSSVLLETWRWLGMVCDAERFLQANQQQAVEEVAVLNADLEVAVQSGNLAKAKSLLAVRKQFEHGSSVGLDDLSAEIATASNAFGELFLWRLTNKYSLSPEQADGYMRAASKIRVPTGDPTPFKYPRPS